VAVAVSNVRGIGPAHHHGSRAGIERADERFSGKHRAKQEMAAVGQKHRSGVVGLSDLRFRDRCGFAAAGGHALKAARAGTEQNHVVGIPRSTAECGDVTYREWSAAGGLDPFELSFRRKADEARIGGPKRRDRAFGAGWLP